MSDAHATPAKAGGGGGSILGNIKTVFYLLVFIFTIVLIIYQTIFNPSNVEFFINVLYGLEIVLGLTSLVLAWRFWKFTVDFHHLCHEIDHVFEHKNHPTHEEYVDHHQELQKKLDEVSEIFKEHDSSLWPANFKQLNILLQQEMQKKNIVGSTIEDMIRDLLSKGFPKRKELDLLLRVKNKVEQSFKSKNTILKIEELNKVADLYEFIIKQIVSFKI